VDKKGKFVDDLVSCRNKNEFTLSRRTRSSSSTWRPHRFVSVAASLIPFLEHDDATCSDGFNMQRQAVPCLRAEKPLVGTVSSARGGGLGHGSDGPPRAAASITWMRAALSCVSTTMRPGREVGVDIYNLTKYTRSKPKYQHQSAAHRESRRCDRKERCDR